MNLLFVIPAVIFAIPASVMARSVLEVRRWTCVPGVVLATKLAVMTYPRSRAKSLRPVIRYSYVVDGKAYQSSVVTYGMHAAGGRRWAARILDRYPVGSSITVRHHPTQPERACLTAVFGFFGWVLTGLASLSALLAVSL